MKSEILSDKEIRKFALQIQLPDVGLAGQEKIKKARVLVIGAGGKGASVLQTLVNSGVGFIGICDNFKVEEFSLPRQSLYGDTDLGKLKAIVARQRLLELTRLTSFELHNICLSESNASTIANNYDILADATDNFGAHNLINDAAIKACKPLVFGSLFHEAVEISVFNYLGGPSLRNLYPTVPEHLQNSDNVVAVSPLLLYCIAGNFMTNEILKIILGHDHVLSGKVLRFSLSDYSCKIESLNPPAI
jgi:molybdopterin/thiamine biosynthesis adenylyltransferase